MIIAEYKLNTCIRSKSALGCWNCALLWPTWGLQSLLIHHTDSQGRAGSAHTTNRVQWIRNGDLVLQNCCAVDFAPLSRVLQIMKRQGKPPVFCQSVWNRTCLLLPYWSIILHYKRHDHINRMPNYTASVYPAERCIHPMIFPSDSSH